jgi:hypothetical protein
MNVKTVASFVAFASIVTVNFVTAAPAQAGFWDDVLRVGARVLVNGAAAELNRTPEPQAQQQDSSSQSNSDYNSNDYNTSNSQTESADMSVDAAAPVDSSNNSDEEF